MKDFEMPDDKDILADLEKEQSAGAPAGTEEPPEEKPAEQPAGSEGTEEKPEKPAAEEPKKTPITEDERKAWNIPEKFKYKEDFVKWGSEAEKEKSRLATKLDELQKNSEDLEGLIKDLQEKIEKKEDQGKDSSEEQKLLEEAERRFREDPDGHFSPRQLKILQDLFDKRDAQIRDKEKQDKEKQTLESYNAEREKEVESLAEKYGEEKWSELQPKLKKIAEERPYLRTFGEALAILEAQERLDSEKNGKDAKDKEAEKLAALSERGSGGGAKAESLADKIAGAKTLDELEALAPKVR